MKRRQRSVTPAWMLPVVAASLLALFLPAALTGCAGSDEKTQQKSGNGMLEPMDPPSGNEARDKYDEMLREEQEERPGY